VFNVLIRRSGSVFLVDGVFRFLLGFNYWPRLLNIKMWREWSEEAIREDVALMKSLGVRVVRVFIKNEDFADAEGNVYRESIVKLRRLLDILHEHGISAFITLLVGHMSGKNWRIPWLDFEELYEPRAIEKTMRFIEAVVREVRDHPAVAGYILSNELSLVKRADRRDKALGLLKAFADTVRRVDRDRVISSGDVPDSYLQETPNVRDYVDYVGPHLYLYDVDLVRHGYMYGAFIELFSNSGDLPVILEEFGFSTHQYSEESHAEFINEVLYTTLAHGASGALVWCFSEFTGETDPPYEWRPLELGFGLVRRDGSLKPGALVVKRFSEELKRVEELGLNTVFKRRPLISVITPFYVFRDYEFVWYKSALGFWEVVKPTLLASILLSSSGLDNTIIYELDVDKVLGGRRLLVAPSTIVMLTSTWRKLLRYVERGGSLYVSLTRSIGNVKAGYEAATHMWTELMGVESALEAGSLGVKYQGEVVVEFTKSLAHIAPGEKLVLKAPDPIYTYKLRPVDSEVLAIDSDGRPVLFRARRGEGYVYTSTIPIELVEASVEQVDWSGKLQALYKSIAYEAGVTPDYEPSNPEVEVKPFYGGKSDIVIAINHGGEKRVTVKARRTIVDVNKIGGNAEVSSWTKSDIHLEMPRKSSIILHVELEL
jgi:endo-1,4-beta-mannosidase